MSKSITINALIPMRTIGPIKICGPEVNDKVEVPLATFESPLWYTTQRGARVSRQTEGIHATILKDFMTRSIVVQGPNTALLAQIEEELINQTEEIANLISQTSRFARLKDWHSQQIADLLYLRLAVKTGDAAGHNMATKAAEAVTAWLLRKYPSLNYVSISSNGCTDKKVSAINGILGRGKYVIAELTIPRAVCEKQLRTTPEKIVDLHIKKNLLGSHIAGSLRSANAHFANILLAAYLATGQDGANIVEGSQGIVHAEVRQQNLYFSITLPNLIVGTVGSGKNLDFVQENLKQLGCLTQTEPGQNARRLAIIIACAVLCGELSLLAALTNPGELIKSHLKLERMEQI